MQAAVEMIKRKSAEGHHSHLHGCGSFHRPRALREARVPRPAPDSCTSFARGLRRSDDWVRGPAWIPPGGGVWMHRCADHRDSFNVLGWVLVCRIDAPFSSIRCALWRRRSQMASAWFGSPMTPCQSGTGSWAGDQDGGTFAPFLDDFDQVPAFSVAQRGQGASRRWPADRFWPDGPGLGCRSRRHGRPPVGARAEACGRRWR